VGEHHDPSYGTDHHYAEHHTGEGHEHAEGEQHDH